MIDTQTFKACIQGLEFPADVHDLVDRAEENGCPRSMVSQIQSSPNRTFSSQDEALCRMGDTEYCHLD